MPLRAPGWETDDADGAASNAIFLTGKTILMVLEPFASSTPSISSSDAPGGRREAHPRPPAQLACSAAALAEQVCPSPFFGSGNAVTAQPKLELTSPGRQHFRLVHQPALRGAGIGVLSIGHNRRPPT
jgi:hypothetical protein